MGATRTVAEIDEDIDAIDAARKEAIDARTVSYTIEGRQVSQLSASQLKALRDERKALCRERAKAVRVANGESPGIRVRYGNVR